MLEMLGVAEPHYAAVTPDEAFRKTQVIRIARSNLEVLTADEPRASLVGPNALRMNWLRVSRATCAQSYEQTWADALHSLATEALPYLDPPAGAELLEAAAPRACRDRLSAGTRAWLELYGAIAARDGRRMAEAAEPLLDQTIAKERKYVALEAAMLGRLATHEPERVVQLYESHRDIAGDQRLSPEIRLMLAIAKNRAASITTTEVARPRL